jgi:hypothetical protein
MKYTWQASSSFTSSSSATPNRWFDFAKAGAEPVESDEYQWLAASVPGSVKRVSRVSSHFIRFNAFHPFHLVSNVACPMQ